jgi:hypothetical protein
MRLLGQSEEFKPHAATTPVSTSLVADMIDRFETSRGISIPKGNVFTSGITRSRHLRTSAAKKEQEKVRRFGVAGH